MTTPTINHPANQPSSTPIAPIITPPTTGKNVLFALDESSHSVAALNWVFDHILQNNDKLTTVVVTDKESSEAVLSRVKTLLRAVWHSNDKNVTMTVRVLHGSSGKAGDLICKFAGEINPAMLVLGSAGKSHVKGLLVGSVSNYCVSHAPCPVIVARMVESEEDARGRRNSLSAVSAGRRRSLSPLFIM
ncbi:hypothetical protein HK097_001713 [Rhizophlyctis rosea]|uniref:UspA domain-containing protein n=1 Tax=Rhizophlyctis rosea TaxID=64517 RepID=A0AAD5S6C7_9FUNG|nr:hypothetical protein HK097_001713 [Rhizophlyctis rosea]